MCEDSSILIRVRKISFIRELLLSKASCTWVDNSIVNRRVNLARFSPPHIGDKSTVLYCTAKDYEKAVSNGQ